jgi:8-oxo-dGTP pyrophosphatase MutT (NUDIX family)
MRAMPYSPANCNSALLDPLYNELLAKTQELPPLGSRALFIAGWRCGWATSAACDVLTSVPHVDVAPGAVHIGQNWQPGLALNALLADVALALREANCLKVWRNELLAVFTGQQTIGAIERATVRLLGLRTEAVHLNAWTPAGQLWIARRSLAKSTDPGMWDTLVGGLVSVNEDLEQALVRECGEEAGLEPTQLAGRDPVRHVLRISRRLPEGYQVEDIWVSRCLLHAETKPVNRDGEVMEIITAPVNEVLARIAYGQFTLEAALVLLNDIKQRRAADEI